MKKKVIGILMLDTTFHRPKGDIGNINTFAFPVKYKIVEGANVDRVVKKSDPLLLEPFIKAAQELEKSGVSAITTSCGFLAIFQQEIQRELSIPFYSSSLLQIPFVKLICGGAILILTASEKNLTERHFQSMDVSTSELVIAGMDESKMFTEAIVEETIPLNVEAVGEEIALVVQQALTDRPEIRAIILECTNMPPYRNRLREITNLPIFDITTLTDYVFEAIK